MPRHSSRERRLGRGGSDGVGEEEPQEAVPKLAPNNSSHQFVNWAGAKGRWVVCISWRKSSRAAPELGTTVSLSGVTRDHCAPGPWEVGSCPVPQGLERLFSPLAPPNQHRLPRNGSMKSVSWSWLCTGSTRAGGRRHRGTTPCQPIAAFLSHSLKISRQI